MREFFNLKMPKGFSKIIHASMLFLNVFGFVMIISASATVNIENSGQLIKGILKESVYVAVAYFFMVKAARGYSHSKLKKRYNLLVLGTVLFLVAALFYSPVNGARAWVRLGLFSLQPSEFAKITIILVLAHSLGEREKSKEPLGSLISHPIFVIVVMSFIVLVLQSDLGSAMIMLMIALFTLMVFANSKLQKIQSLFLFLYMAFILLIFNMNNTVFIDFIDRIPWPDKMHYMIDRIRTNANPFLDRYNSGAQIFNGLAAFVSGGLFGVGYGKGFLKFSFIFSAESDSILPIIVEELGVIFGFLPIVAGYTIILYQLMKYTFLVQNEKDKAILVGTIAYFFVHFLFNVGGVSGIIPLTGVPLLFISAGGSSRVAVMIALGLSQRVIANYHASLGEKQ